MDNLDREVHSASFRDPSGNIFFRNETIYRQINRRYADNFDRLVESGLYDELTSRGLLIPHREVDVQPMVSGIAYKIIKPEPIRFISYPYEWCFSQFKDAALTTLVIHKLALEKGMSLKDASSYNI